LFHLVFDFVSKLFAGFLEHCRANDNEVKEKVKAVTRTISEDLIIVGSTPGENALDRPGHL
jgi:hypothetical protein